MFVTFFHSLSSAATYKFAINYVCLLFAWRGYCFDAVVLSCLLKGLGLRAVLLGLLTSADCVLESRFSVVINELIG